MKLSGNTILITGATSGIGLGLARRFLAEGNEVIVAGRRDQLLASIVAEHPRMAGVVLDVSDPESVRRCFAAVTADFPRLNVLINNAGIMVPEDLTHPDHWAVAEATVATNLVGPMLMVNHFLPHLLDQGDAVIMNVTSGRAFVPLPLTPTYSATKAAIHSFTESLRVQLADRGVDVLELIPPRVQTDLMGQSRSPDAMPLEAFLDEVMGILRSQPDEAEICVESVKTLRYAEATGTYAQALTMIGGVH